MFLKLTSDFEFIRIIVEIRIVKIRIRESQM